MRALVKAAVDFGIPLSDENASQLVMRPENEVLYGPLSTELYNAIRTLWADPGTRQAFDRSSEFQLLDSTQ